MGLFGLVALGILGAALELAFERHWQSAQQLVPWGALLVLAAGLVLLALDAGPLTIKVIRWLALAVLLASAFGVYAHITANHDMGSFDPRYADTWQTLSPLTQWWYALTKSVGPAPPLAPGMLAQSALLLLLTTLIPARRPA
ncbi:MAG: hypothetical protein HOV96_24545 [Nonomuraea sp.]|nr:hypothetical protein [Nonomuraea sp.]NUP61366.1 hypothetical protein [Nonomuraea sp.]NUP80720.1 hypothetical protein [Nonomuraea sp.]NUS07892.1 hypothetical protein [Nonomuraea sp.]